MKRSAIYARYSSDLQSPSSIEDQLRLCRAYAERQGQGWTVVATFEDRAVSGVGVDHRPGYQQLMTAALSPARPFDVILVEDLSRLTREISETDTLYRRLRLRGIDLVGVSDGVDTSRRGAAVHIALKGVMNAIYLDDLAAKTHRGLEGRVVRGMSPGGRLFGYRTVSVPDESHAGKRDAPTRFEIDEREADVVRRIFRDYSAGRSMKAIAHRLNAEGIPFPAKDTKRGPARRGWAVSTIQVMLRNEKYAGVWVWNRTRFLKDPDTGRRRPVPRPPDEWIRQERPALRIVDPDLWAAVQARAKYVEEAFGYGPGRPPRGGARVAYSLHLLAGVLRCGVCGARMVAMTATRKKADRTYRYGWYRCGFARDKGPAVCAHGAWYRRERLEGALLGKFREATTPAMIAAVTRAVNDHVDAMYRQRDTDADRVKAEILRLERQAGNLVRFIADGGDVPTVREELRTIEEALGGLRVSLVELEGTPHQTPRVHPAWVRAKLNHLGELVRSDVARARAEIVKHLDGDLIISPRPSVAGVRRAEVSGRVKANSLLAEQEAVCLQVVAGGRFGLSANTPLTFRFEVEA